MTLPYLVHLTVEFRIQLLACLLLANEPKEFPVRSQGAIFLGSTKPPTPFPSRQLQ